MVLCFNIEMSGRDPVLNIRRACGDFVLVIRIGY